LPKRAWSCESNLGSAMTRNGPREPCPKRNSSILPSMPPTCSKPLPRLWRSKSPLSSQRSPRSLSGSISMRLNKYISETGVCSRREADKWIEAGRVTCNGAPAALGTRVSDGDEVCVDGKPRRQEETDLYRAQQAGRYYLHHGSACRGEHHRSGRPRGTYLSHRPAGQGLRGLDPDDEQWRHRQRNIAFGEQSREGIHRDGGSADNRSIAQDDGRRH